MRTGAQLAWSAGMGLVFGAVVSLVIAVVSPHARPVVAIVFGAASSIPTAFMSFYIIHILSFDGMSRALMNVCKRNMDGLTRAKMAVVILRSCHGDVKIEFSTTVDIWVKLLTAGAEAAKKDWFTTYTIPLEDWQRISGIVKQYTVALASNTSIAKMRNIVQETIPMDVGESVLVADSKTAGATVCVYKASDVKGILPTKDGVEDYAMFDEEFVISGFPPRGRDLRANTIVRVVMLKGNGSEMGTYQDAKTHLAVKVPARKF